MNSQEQQLVSKLESLNNALAEVVTSVNAVIYPKRIEYRQASAMVLIQPKALQAIARRGSTDEIKQLPELATRKEVANWASCSTRQIDRLVNTGTFPAPVRIGEAPRWRRPDLLKWLDEQTDGAE